MSAAPVFIFGTARSGTTWLQNMLGAHPEIATPQELDLFTDYIAPWHAAWRYQFPESAELWHRHRHKGLPAVLTEEDFVELGQASVSRIYDSVLALKPGARIVLEKVPAYTQHVRLIRRHFPEARFIHIIRDGRDVACSLLRASASFGRTWSTNSLDRAAWSWRTNVTSGREAAESLNYTEVRYERLRSDEGPAALAELLAFCGVEADAVLCASIYDGYTLKPGGGHPPSSIVWGGEVRRRLRDRPVEPAGFYGEGRVGTWREQLTPYERWVFERVAGALLCELGYESDGEWARLDAVSRALAPARLWVARQASRARFAIGAAHHTWRDRPAGAMRPPPRTRTSQQPSRVG